MKTETKAKLVAMVQYPGWGVSLNGQLICGPMSYEDAEDEIARIEKLQEVRS